MSVMLNEHLRIVAEKDAEIGRLNERIDETDEKWSVFLEERLAYQKRRIIEAVKGTMWKLVEFTLPSLADKMLKIIIAAIEGVK